VTDSDAVLGYLPAKGFAGGRMELDVEAGRAAIARDVAEPMGLSIEDAAWSIQRIVNANMANAVRKVLSQHGADPARSRSSPTAVVAPCTPGRRPGSWASIACSCPRHRRPSPPWGCWSPTTWSISCGPTWSSCPTSTSRVRTLAAELRAEAEAELAPARLGEGTVQADLFAQMCYHGQNFDMSVPLPEGESLSEDHLLDLADRFHHQHEASRGFAFPNQQPLVRGIRLVHRGATPKPPVLAKMGDVTNASDARTGSRPVHFGHGYHDVTTYDGAMLGAGAVSKDRH
jgi:N-methylhydantoinase A